jgi:hypothetical protein
MFMLIIIKSRDYHWLGDNDVPDFSDKMSECRCCKLVIIVYV